MACAAGSDRAAPRGHVALVPSAAAGVVGRGGVRGAGLCGVALVTLLYARCFGKVELADYFFVACACDGVAHRRIERIVGYGGRRDCDGRHGKDRAQQKQFQRRSLPNEVTR